MGLAYTRITTMEAANESGRHAVAAILYLLMQQTDPTAVRSWPALKTRTRGGHVVGDPLLARQGSCELVLLKMPNSLLEGFAIHDINNVPGNDAFQHW